MNRLTLTQIRILIFLVKRRLRNEKFRPAKIRHGQDIQAAQVWELHELQSTLENMESDIKEERKIS